MQLIRLASSTRLWWVYLLLAGPLLHRIIVAMVMQLCGKLISVCDIYLAHGDCVYVVASNFIVPNTSMFDPILYIYKEHTHIQYSTAIIVNVRQKGWNLLSLIMKRTYVHSHALRRYRKIINYKPCRLRITCVFYTLLYTESMRYTTQEQPTDKSILEE